MSEIISREDIEAAASRAARRDALIGRGLLDAIGWPPEPEQAKTKAEEPAERDGGGEDAAA